MSTAAHRRLHLSLTSGAKRLGALLVFCGCSGVALAVGMCPGDGQALFTDPKWGFPHVGGVLLDKSLTLLNEIDNIEAAVYDSATGEIVLVGQGTVPIDERIELDDLVVAVKSIYGLGTVPGITFYTDEPRSAIYQRGEWGVTYLGATQDTAFGQILYDADFLLKQLGLGIDPAGRRLLDQATIAAQLAALNYKSFAQRLFEAGLTNTGYSTEFWLQPAEVVVAIDKAADGQGRGFVFRNVQMEVAFRILDGSNNEVQNPDPAFRAAAQAFVDNLTANYDSYANIQGFEALKKLKRLGKITAVVNWLRSANIPVDLSFVANYRPNQPVVTPQRATVLRSCRDPEGNLSQNDNGPYTSNMPFCPGIIGGIAYDKNNAYCTATGNDFDATNPCLSAAETTLLTNALSSQNRNENAVRTSDLKWTMIANGQSHSASAQTVAPSGKEGNIRLSTADLSFPNQAGQALTFSRFYDSFSTFDFGFGPGWSPFPFGLALPGAADFYASDATPPYHQHYFFSSLSLVDRVSARTVQFVPSLTKFVGYPTGFMPITVDGRSVFVPAYTAEGGANDLILDFEYVRAGFTNPLKGRFLYFKLAPFATNIYSSKGVWFEPGNGDAKWIANPTVVNLPGASGSGDSVDLYFDFSASRLVSIRTESNRKIDVGWTNNRITSTSFKGTDGLERRVDYQYDARGRLWRVTQAGKTLELEYADASDPSQPGTLRKIRDVYRGENRVVWAGDMQHRATRLRPRDEGARETTVDHDRRAGITTVTTAQGTVATTVRDAQGRPSTFSRIGNVRGTSVAIGASWDYAPGANRYAGPSRFSDARGYTTNFGYDQFGLPATITESGSGIATRSTEVVRGRDAVSGAPIVVTYDAKGRASLTVFDAAGRAVTHYRRVNITERAPCPSSSGTACFRFSHSAGARVDLVYGAGGDVDQLKVNGGLYTARYPWLPFEASRRVTSRDGLGLATAVQSAAGYVATAKYDGLARPEWVQHPGDTSKTYLSYFATGVAQDRVQVVESPVAEVSYSYDVKSRQSSVADARGVTTTRIFDQAGLLLRVVETAPLGEQVLTTQYFYDAQDRLTKTFLPNGFWLEHTYDGHGRPLSTIEHDGAQTGNLSPVVTSTVQKRYSKTAGQSFQLDINAADANGDPLHYTIINPPQGMTISQATGLISWTPTANDAGSHVVVVQVLDSKGGIAVATFGFDVWPSGSVDSDGDGVPDPYDIEPKDNRYARDLDLDGLPDEWEQAHGMADTHNDAYEDADGDDLLNLDEYRHGTDPNSEDTDGDGMLDGEEVAVGRNPTVDERAVITILNMLSEE